MAGIELKRSTPGPQPARPRLHPLTTDSDKLRAYRALYLLNRAFERVCLNLDRLQDLGFRREFLVHFCRRAEELRAEANQELTETLNQRELKDWTWFGRHTLRWEKQRRDPRDPNDVLREADRIRAQRRQQQQQRKPKTTTTRKSKRN